MYLDVHVYVPCTQSALAEWCSKQGYVRNVGRIQPQYMSYKKNKQKGGVHGTTPDWGEARDKLAR